MKVNGTLISGNNIHTKQHVKFSLDERPIKNEIKEEVKEQIDNSDLMNDISGIRSDIENMYSIFNNLIIYEEDVAIYGVNRYLTLEEFNTIKEAAIYAFSPNKYGKYPCAIIQTYLDPTLFIHTFVTEWFRNTGDLPQGVTENIDFIIINSFDIVGSTVESCSLIIGFATDGRSNDQYSYVTTIDI